MTVVPGSGPADPVGVIVGLVAAVDPGLDPEVVAAAVAAAAPESRQRARLAHAVAGRPDLLTGAGAHSPVPTVLRLVEYLCAAGAAAIIRPACPRCQRAVALSKKIDGLRVCRNCCAKANAQPCQQCGAVRQPGSRTPQGRPICSYCLGNDPANQEECVGCGNRRLVAVRTADGPRCGTCRPRPTMVCAICGRSGRCTISRATAKPWCSGCRQRWDQCVECSQIKPVVSGRRDQPRCASCTRPDPSYWQRCPACGEADTERMWGGPCPRCLLRQRLDGVLSGPDGTIRPELALLRDSVLAHDRPVSALGWLDHGPVAKLLSELTTGGAKLSHDRLDELPDSAVVGHLRSLLVAAGGLPPRDEQLNRAQRWVQATIAAHADPRQRQLLHRYAVWFMLRRLRGRTSRTQTTAGQANGVRRRLRAAIATLDWLSAHGLTLDGCRQADLDSFLSGAGRSRRFEVTHFIRWAADQRLTTVALPGSAWTGPQGTMDTELRWEQARRLLHDGSLATVDRLTGLLILLYAQFPATIAALRTEDIDTTGNQVRLRLGDQPIILPEPMADLTRDMLTTTPRRAIGEPAASGWLFPGGRPGHHITSTHLCQRLRRIGIHPKPSREAALFQLANDIPAAILARMLGIHISVATTWQRLAAGDWTRYAAHLDLTHPDRTP